MEDVQEAGGRRFGEQGQQAVAVGLFQEGEAVEMGFAHLKQLRVVVEGQSPDILEHQIGIEQDFVVEGDGAGETLIESLERDLQNILIGLVYQFK